MAIESAVEVVSCGKLNTLRPPKREIVSGMNIIGIGECRVLEELRNNFLEFPGRQGFIGTSSIRPSGETPSMHLPTPLHISS